jgi:hypothetical protein
MLFKLNLIMGASCCTGNESMYYKKVSVATKKGENGSMKKCFSNKENVSPVRKMNMNADSDSLSKTKSMYMDANWSSLSPCLIKSPLVAKAKHKSRYVSPPKH